MKITSPIKYIGFRPIMSAERGKIKDPKKQPEIKLEPNPPI